MPLTTWFGFMSLLIHKMIIIIQKRGYLPLFVLNPFTALRNAVISDRISIASSFMFPVSRKED